MAADKEDPAKEDPAKEKVGVEEACFMPQPLLADKEKEGEPDAADPDAVAAAAAAEDDEDSDSDSEVNWVEMPLEHVRWILAKKRESDPVPTLEDFGIYTQEDLDREDADMLIRRTIASLQASQDDFFEYQAWVREVFERNGCVMVPEGVLGRRDELQKAIDEDWSDIVDVNAGDDDDSADPDAVAEAAAGGGNEEEEDLVEMPEDYLRWLLAQTRDTDPVPTLDDYSTRDPQKLERLQEEIDWLQASQDEFFEYQASVRDKLQKDGRVMIPAAAVHLREQFLEAIDEYWYGMLKEYDNAAGSNSAADSNTEVAKPFN